MKSEKVDVEKIIFVENEFNINAYFDLWCHILIGINKSVFPVFYSVVENSDFTIYMYIYIYIMLNFFSYF